MSVNNIAISNFVDPRKSSDDAHLLIGRALGQTVRRENDTESSVCCPPAAYITDRSGAIWTLGFDYIEYPYKYEFMVLRNDQKTGQFAEKIEYRNGIVRLFGKDGTRTVSRDGKSFI